MDTRSVHLFPSLLRFPIRGRNFEGSSNRILDHSLSSQRFSFHGLIPYVSWKPKLDSTASDSTAFLPLDREQLDTSRLTREPVEKERKREREGERGRERREAVGTNKFNIGRMERRKVLETMGTGDGKGNVVAFVTRCIRCCPMGGRRAKVARSTPLGRLQPSLVRIKPGY